eukprot:TRINITY_DN5750_c0_g1_i1.p1 TRINITY_DN5750_c0_g1~~TRINITY_DN5750_c0_g1_i1.p1  ORF type:complete len:377 (-),score=61.89 TRINITY_DN5750_c0_g1_i1:265-1395(-)
MSMMRGRTACECCRKIRRKCSGTTPCARCILNNLSCLYTERKKRGPPRKRTRESTGYDSGNGNDDEEEEFDRNNLIKICTPAPSLNVDHILFFQDIQFRFLDVTSAIKISPQVDKQIFFQATTSAQFMLQQSLLAHITHHSAGEKSYVEKAKQISKEIYDSVSTYETACAFIYLASICYSLGDICSEHYAHVAWSHARRLKNDNPMITGMKDYAFVMSLMLDSTISPSRRCDEILLFSTIYPLDSASSIARKCIITAAMSIMCLNATVVRERGLFAAIQFFELSLEIQTQIAEHIDKLELIIPHVFQDFRAKFFYLWTKLFKIVSQLARRHYVDAQLSSLSLMDSIKQFDFSPVYANLISFHFIFTKMTIIVLKEI